MYSLFLLKAPHTKFPVNRHCGSGSDACGLTDGNTYVILTLIHENVVDMQNFGSWLMVTRDSRVR